MDEQIQKLKKLVKIHLHQTKIEILKIWGKPNKNSDDYIWFYSWYNYGIFKDEIAFIFDEHQVVDICITSYIFWIKYKNTFYYENQKPEYKAFTIL